MEKRIVFCNLNFLHCKKAKDYENSLDAIAAEVSYVEKDELTGTNTTTAVLIFSKVEPHKRKQQIVFSAKQRIPRCSLWKLHRLSTHN